MLYKVTLTKTVEVFIESDSEEQVNDWANTHTPDDAEIICSEPKISYTETIEQIKKKRKADIYI